jgi:lysophospholipase L1-like esterase
LIGLVTIHGGRLVLVTQAHQKKYAKPLEYKWAEQMNDELRKLADLYVGKVYFYDFSREVAPKIDELMVRDGVHFDEPGYQLLGESVAQYIFKTVR